jgi:hypothetical protein
VNIPVYGLVWFISVSCVAATRQECATAGCSKIGSFTIGAPKHVLFLVLPVEHQIQNTLGKLFSQKTSNRGLFATVYLKSNTFA